MKKIDKKSTPFLLLNSLKAAIDSLNSILNENNLIIEKIDSDQYYFSTKDIDPKSTFTFSLEDISFKPQSSEITFLYHFSPANDTSLNSVSRREPVNTLLSHFKYWIDLIEAYNTIEISEEEKFFKQYEEEFETFFEIIDEDAETSPFEHEKQEFIFKYLEKFITKLQLESSTDPYLHTVIDEATIIQNNLQNLTKKQTIKSLSKIWAKTRKFGIKLLLDVLDVGKKEIIKTILTSGANHLSDLSHQLLNSIT